MIKHEEKIEKIVRLMTHVSKFSGRRFTFGDIDFIFDPSCPNEKEPGKGYKNITKDEYRKACNILHNLLKTNLLKRLPSGYMRYDPSIKEYVWTEE